MFQSCLGEDLGTHMFQSCLEIFVKNALLFGVGVYEVGDPISAIASP